VFLSRRWFYFVPAEGEPLKLVHQIEQHALAFAPGTKKVYLRWQELEAGVAALVSGSRRIAMEYVPRNANPYVSRVDAGTVELVRSCGVEIVPSGDLIQLFEACWDEEQWPCTWRRLNIRGRLLMGRLLILPSRCVPGLAPRNRGRRLDHAALCQNMVW